MCLQPPSATVSHSAHIEPARGRGSSFAKLFCQHKPPCPKKKAVTLFRLPWWRRVTRTWTDEVHVGLTRVHMVTPGTCSAADRRGPCGSLTGDPSVARAPLTQTKTGRWTPAARTLVLGSTRSSLRRSRRWNPSVHYTATIISWRKGSVWE